MTRGTIAGHYRIVEKIGAGGAGEVYQAEDTELDRMVALKSLPPHLCQDEVCRKRFKRDPQAAAKLIHPNITMVYEVGDVDFSGGLANPMDVIFMQQYVYFTNDMRTQPPNCPFEAGDVDCDSQVNPVDVVRYVNYVYKGITPFPCDPCAP